MTALCAAALKPSRETWERFLQHLKKLQEQGQVSSDESVAILATSFLDEYLSDAEDADATGPDSFIEIIDRVKAKYRTDAEAKVREAQLHAEAKVREAQLQKCTAVEKARQSELWVKSLVDYIASVFTLLVVTVVGVFILAGLVLCLPGFYDLWPGPRWIGWIPITAFAVLTVLNLLRGTALTSIFRGIRSWATKKLEIYTPE